MTNYGKDIELEFKGYGICRECNERYENENLLGHISRHYCNMVILCPKCSSRVKFQQLMGHYKRWHSEECE